MGKVSAVYRLSSRLPILAAVALALASCARREPPPAPPQPQVRPEPGRSVPSPAEYVARAASIDLFLVRSSQLALSRSQNPRLRDFARRMIEEHHGTAGQLSLAGRRLNLLPSTVLLPEQRRMMDELQQSQQFDTLYWRQQVTMHSVAIDLHGNYSLLGTSPTLKPVAAAAMPIYRRHLDQLRAIR